MVRRLLPNRAVTTVPSSIVIGVTSPMSLMLMRGLPERLASDGWDVTVVSSPGIELDDLGRSGGIRVKAISMVREPSLVADAKSLVEWCRVLRGLNPDVILVGTPKAGMLGVIAGVLTRVPVRIYHLRGLRLETERGLRRVVFRAVEALTLRAATVTVAVSRSLKDRVVDLGLVRESRMKVLGLGSSNGVDTERFRPATDSQDIEAQRIRVGVEPGVPVIGYVGRIHPDKGLVTLLGASRLLTARGIAHQLLIVGGTDHPSAQGLVAQLSSLSAGATLTGAVTDVAPYYQAMDVHCLPTLREGFPNAVLEASASGVVTVTTDATGAVDSVVPGETGYIVRTQHASGLADALTEALSDPEHASRLGRNARNWVVENFSRTDVQSNLVDFLRRSADNLATKRTHA